MVNGCNGENDITLIQRQERAQQLQEKRKRKHDDSEEQEKKLRSQTIAGTERVKNAEQAKVRKTAKETIIEVYHKPFRLMRWVVVGLILIFIFKS